MKDTEATVTFIGVENWGEDGDLYWAPGHHAPADFIEAVERSHTHQCGNDQLEDLYGTFGVDEVTTYRAEAIKETEHTFGRFTVPVDLDPQYAGNPLDSEEVRIHFSEELESGGFPITFWLVG